MRTYELVFIFRNEEDLYKKGLETAKAELKKLGANVQKEEDWGEKTLAYPIKKRDRGHYTLLILEMDPSKVIEADRIFKLQTDILKFQFIVQES